MVNVGKPTALLFMSEPMRLGYRLEMNYELVRWLDGLVVDARWDKNAKMAGLPLRHAARVTSGIVLSDKCYVLSLTAVGRNGQARV